MIEKIIINNINMKSINKNLILGAAVGYSYKDLKNFIATLRNFYSQDVFLIVANNIDEKTNDFFEKNKIQKIVTEEDKKLIYKKRYNIYYNFIRKNSYEKILITDTRDVFFQKDPFKNHFLKKINFFIEDKKIQECKHNSRWIKKLYGKKILKKLSDKYISCSGTTIGYRNEMLMYLKCMIQHIEIYKYFSFSNSPGTDQGNHNNIVYLTKFNKYKKYSNSDGYIATLANSDIKNFKLKNKLKNNKNIAFDIIHQYDRFFKKNNQNYSLEVKRYFSNLIKKLSLQTKVIL